MATFTPLLDILADVPDPRRAEGKIYKLPFVLLFSILAIVSGSDSYRGIVTFIDPSSLGVKSLTIAADNLEGGCTLSLAATLVDDRSARTSTTHRRSRSTMMVP